MRYFLLIIAVVALVGCGESKEDGNTGVVKPNSPSPKAVPEKLITNPIVEKAVRKRIKKPTGKLTEADLERITILVLDENQLTEVPKGLEKLTQLNNLLLGNNQLTSVEGLEKLEKLWLNDNKLTDVKGLENLTQLTALSLTDNPDLTKAQIDPLKKALPKCYILRNPNK